MNTFYYADHMAADQGAAGTRTIKGLVTAIGSTKQATIVVAHNSNSTNTTYTVSTDLTLSSNITLKVERGALISIDTGKTLTISGQIDAGNYQTFSGDGTVLGLNEVNPDWFGADNTGVVSSSDAFNKAAASEATKFILTRGATYKVKDVVLPAVSFFHFEGNHAEIIADGTDGDAATACFTVTFDANTGLDSDWYHFWTFDNLYLKSGYLSDFLVINITNQALVTDIHINNIKAKGGLNGTGDPANSVIKVNNPSSMTSEAFNVSSIEVNGGACFDHVVHIVPGSTTKTICGTFKDIFHSVYTDGLSKTIYNEGTFGRSNFSMIYSAGGHVIEAYCAVGSVFDRIYQESLVNQDSTAVVIVGNAAAMAFQNCEFRNIRTVRSAKYGNLHEKLFTGSCFNCKFSNLSHNTRGDSLDYATVVISSATSAGNWIGDLWSTGDADTQYWDGVSDAGKGTKYGHAEKVSTGTWTPTVTGSSTAGTITLASGFNTGYYKREGDLVYVSGILKIGTVADSPAGLLKISLPYTVATGNQYSAGIAISLTSIDSGYEAAGVDMFFAYADPTNKFITVNGINNGAYVSIAEFFTANALIRFSGSYIAKSDGT